MCAGVRRAIRIAQAVRSPEDTTIFGELVHNEQVTSHLRERGFELTSTSDGSEVPSTRTVLIPAHGVSRPERRRLVEAGKGLVDATCPLVQHIHDTALAMAGEGRFVIVVGRRSHVEVKGIVGGLTGYAVVAGPEEVTRYAAEKLGIVCQSTASTVNAEHTVRRIRALNPDKDIRYVPTICRATYDRQSGVRSLLDQVDALVVVGGRNSNNTLELVNLARSRGVPCFHIQGAADLREEWFARTSVAGLTAGASTPDEAIEAVYAQLASFSADAVSPLLETMAQW
jgi:4-hydroxy-3-methylbut-2-enyl diphosphate reductase